MPYWNTMKKDHKPNIAGFYSKLSGEALGARVGLCINAQEIQSMAEQVREVRDLGVKVVIVLGGGNIFADWPAVKRASSAPRAITWECSRRSSTRSRCRMRWKNRRRDACKQPSPCRRWRRRSSGAVRCGI